MECPGQSTRYGLLSGPFSTDKPWTDPVVFDTSGDGSSCANVVIANPKKIIESDTTANVNTLRVFL
jgi:hypothetical protein